MSIYLNFESLRNYLGTEFRGAVSKLEKKIQIRASVFTFSVKLEIWSFHVAELPENGKEMYRQKKSTSRACKNLVFLY